MLLADHHPNTDAAPWMSILDPALDAAAVIDSAGKVREWNAAAERTFGLSRQQALGQPIAEMLFSPRQAASRWNSWLETVSRAMPEEERQNLQVTATRPGGGQVPLEVSGRALSVPYTDLFVLYLRDVSRHDRSQALLRNQEELQTVSASASDAVFLLADDGKITYANRAAEVSFGCVLAEMKGASLGELIRCSCDRGRDCPGSIAPLSASGDAPVEPYYHAVAHRMDGQKIEVSCSFAPVIKEGAVTGGVVSMRNLSDQRQLERSLFEVSRRLDAHLNNSPLAALEFTPGGTILRWSPAAERLFGWPAAEMVGKNLSLFPWLIVNPIVLEDGGGTELPPEWCAADSVRTSAGRFVDIAWHHSEFRNNDGRLVSILWLGLDVTARTHAEQAMRESELRLRATLEQAPAGIAHFDIQCRFVVVNDKYCDIMGYSREELLGHTFHEITYPDDRAADVRYATGLFEGLYPGYSCEKRNVRKDGSIVWVSVTVSLVCDTTQGFRFMLAIVSDISDRKRAEEHLKQSRDSYRFLADAMPHMVFTATPEGHGDYHNRSWLQYTGQSFEDALSRGWKMAVHPDDLASFTSSWQTALSTGSPFQMEARFRRTDGVYRWHLVRALPRRDPQGRILQWVGAATDTEDQKQTAADLERRVNEQTAEAREQARRAESASQAKSEFLAMMSHEIRTPMNVIVGLAELMQESAMPPEQRDYVNRLRRAGATLLTLINDILDLAAVESRHLRIQQVSFDLQTVVQNVVAIMEFRARERGLQLLCDVSPDVPHRLLGDPDRLHQILLNLTGNAIKFTAKGAVHIRIGGTTGHGSAELSFSVQDTGIGIPPEKQQLIFLPFTQADSSITRQYGGTGLGLAISRQLVELMHGRIWVESQQGCGSTFSFTVTFPLAAEEVHTNDNQASESSETGSMSSLAEPSDQSPRSILVVDDCSDNIFLVKEFLKGTRFAADVAENGMEAIAKIQASHYELVLMDMQMPIMDGETTTRNVRAWEAANRRPAVPILAFSAHALQSQVEKSIQAGCTAHLSKPIQRRALLLALEQYAVVPPARIQVTAPEGLEELSRGYLERRREGMDKLRDLLDRGDHDGLRRLAHDIKGTGASYGFPPLTNVASILERAAIAKDLDGMMRALASMETYLQSVDLIPGAAPAPE